MSKVQRLAPDRRWNELIVVLTDDAGIQPVNAQHLDSSEVTDVISFCYDPIPGENAGLTGEIIVNAQRAAERGAGSRHWNALSELALYVAHGCDHLADESDYDTESRMRMRRRELRWLREARTKGLLEPLA
jgi:rRNA maturation RNase YbeY